SATWHVRSAPKSDIKCDIWKCPLWANSGHHNYSTSSSIERRKGQSAFGVGLKPAQDLRPALMAGSRAFGGKARMGQANRRQAVLFMKIKPHQRLGRFLVPRWQPGEGG